MCINANAIKEVNKLFYSFLWNGKGDRIERNVIINDYPDGGLKMIDIGPFPFRKKTRKFRSEQKWNFRLVKSCSIWS